MYELFILLCVTFIGYIVLSIGLIAIVLTNNFYIKLGILLGLIITISAGMQLL